MNDKREHLLKGNIVSLLFELTVPGIIGMLVISLYVFVDAIFVGRSVSARRRCFRAQSADRTKRQSTR